MSNIYCDVPCDRKEASEPLDRNVANSYQHGGDHYQKLAIQHWDYVVANGIPYLEACAIKYLTRWRDKGGIEDLKKAKHYVDKLIEVETAKTVKTS